MIRMVLSGGLALIVVYVVSQTKTSEKVEAGSNTLIAIMRRMLSPSVAGVPDKRPKQKQKPSGTTEPETPYTTIYHV